MSGLPHVYYAECMDQTAGWAGGAHHQPHSAHTRRPALRRGSLTWCDGLGRVDGWVTSSGWTPTGRLVYNVQDRQAHVGQPFRRWPSDGRLQHVLLPLAATRDGWRHRVHALRNDNGVSVTMNDSLRRYFPGVSPPRLQGQTGVESTGKKNGPRERYWFFALEAPPIRGINFFVIFLILDVGTLPTLVNNRNNNIQNSVC